MGHGEDEQPNESTLGRPKRVMPFVANTSRGRGRGGSRGNHSFVDQGRGRGRGRGFNTAVSIAPGSSRGGHFQASSSASSSSVHLTVRQLPPIPASDTGGHESGTRMPVHGLPQRPQPAPEVNANTNELVGHADTLMEDTASTSGPSKRPRPRKRGWRPGARGRFRKDAASPRTGTPDSSAWEAHSGDQIRPDDSPSHGAHEPLAKRPRLDGDPDLSRASPVKNTPPTAVKSEAVDESPVSSTQEQATSGSKFISYDKYPKCRFNCGRPPEEVRSNRKSIKGQEVASLLKQGLKVNAAFIRDDGIAIDWSLPTETQVDASAPPPTLSLYPAEPELPTSSSTPDLVSSHDTNSASTPPQDKLPSRLDPLTTPAYNLPTQRSDTPALTDIAYREVQIPARHLPRRGDTRKLEIWVVEQMRLLEAELGSVLLPPPELIGVGEYIAGRALPNGAAPTVRIRYKRPVRASGNSQQTMQQNDQHNNEPTPLMSHKTSILQHRDTTPPPIDPRETTLPPIAHLAQPPSPTPAPPSTPPIIKSELDELALNPPSPLAGPGPDLPTVMMEEPAPPFPDLNDLSRTHISEVTLSVQPILTSADPPVEPASTPSAEELEIIRRLRADLEKSRLEAEQKHRDLEQRIRELSNKTSDPDSSDVSAVSYNAPSVDNVRIVDDTQSKLLVLRRGKHDKTRRLLSVSSSTVLHVSWLGVMQMVNKDARQIIAAGFEEGAPDSISIEDACLLSSSSVALALAGSGSQLGIATLGNESFKLLSLPGQPHETKGICAITTVNPTSVITLGHDHRYVHWQLNEDCYSTTPLPLHKLQQCTALTFEPISSSVITAGSDSGKNGKLTLHGLNSSQHTSTTVDLSNHVHHVHTDSENPSLLVLELARLDDQFQVHDMRLPLYRCVQKFGYQNIVHERGGFRTRGSTRGHLFARGDTGIVRSWDRRHLVSYQTTQVVPHQKVVEVILDGSSLVCATESHHITSYSLF